MLHVIVNVQTIENWKKFHDTALMFPVILQAVRANKTSRRYMRVTSYYTS